MLSTRNSEGNDMGNYLCPICKTYHDTTGCPTPQQVFTTHITNHCPICEARARQQAEKGCPVCALRNQQPNRTELYAGLVEAAEKIVIQVNRLENLATVQNPQIAKFLYDANNNLKAALGRVKG